MPSTKQEFGEITASIRERVGYVMPQYFSLGVSIMHGNTIVDFRPVTIQAHDDSAGTAAVLHDVAGPLRGGAVLLNEKMIRKALDYFAPFEGEKGHANIDALKNMLHLPFGESFHEHRQVPMVVCVDDVDQPATNAAEAYLRLAMISKRMYKPNTINLDGIFGLLGNNVWTDHGVFSVDAFDAIQAELTALGDPIRVYLQDKIPHMLDYVSVPGVRIADPSRVRLGAYLAEGTTVMQEGFINFNAGTLGACMVEGRLSAGVVVGEGSDIGGGASTMGTLSGGNDVRVSIGEHCLLEAEAGLGIPVGDRVRIEAGFYLKSTTPVFVIVESPDWDLNEHDAKILGMRGDVVKAEKLMGQSDLIFRRDAQSGRVECVPRGNRTWGKLNEILHAN